MLTFAREANETVICLQVFGHEPKYWTKLNFDLMALDKKSRDQQSYDNSSSGDHELVYQISQQFMQ